MFVCSGRRVRGEKKINYGRTWTAFTNVLMNLHFTIAGTSGTKYDIFFTVKGMVGNTNIAMRTTCKADGLAANVLKWQMRD